VLALLVTLVVSGVAPVPAGAGTAHRPDLHAALEGLVAKGVPGAALLVRDGDRTTRLAAGVADLVTGRPMRPDLRFRAGSVTKTFVATVVLQLEAEGLLSLDDSVEHWLPGLVPHGGRISIRQLLSHTSGLFDYLEDPRVFEPYLAGQLDYRWRPRQLVRLGTSHPPLFPPGAGWSYSNTGYILLGLIVEAATGHDVGAELERRIIRPLHLGSTSFETGAALRGAHAQGYTAALGAGLTDITFLSQSFTWTAGALASTVDDLGVFLGALLGGRLLPPTQLAEMEDTVPLGLPGEGYGLGLWRTARFILPPVGELSCGERVWGHDGDTAGYRSFAFASRDGHDQVVLLLDADGESVSPEATAAIVDLLDQAVCG
jgi:D-alanyl-D-alanine carboxypeptidase